MPPRFCRCEYGRRHQHKSQKKLTGFYSSAGVPARLKKLTLETFDEAAGGDPGKEAAREATRQFLDSYHVFDEEKGRVRRGLYFYGPNGRGKSGLMAGLARALYERGHLVLWIGYHELYTDIQAAYGQNARGADVDLATLRMHQARRVSHLFLDDLGDPFRSDSSYQETTDRRRILHDVISARHAEERPTFITSNFRTLRGIADQFDPRIADRVGEMCAMIEVAGENLRFKKGGTR